MWARLGLLVTVYDDFQWIIYGSRRLVNIVIVNITPHFFQRMKRQISIQHYHPAVYYDR